MAWNEWAVSSAQTTPADTTTTDTAVLNTATNSVRADGTWRNGASSNLNEDSVYPIVRTGAAPDDWSVRDETMDAFAYIADPADATGLLYEITRGYREMTYQEAKTQARNRIDDYIRQYRTSYFEAATKWYSADADETMNYLVANADFARNPAATHVVFSVDSMGYPISSEAEWSQFWNAFSRLYSDAAQSADEAWTNVKNATTTAEVKTIIEGLEIPAPSA